jgi:hypothetical protein
VSASAADALVRAVLYEGYLLYPYRRSSVKNRHRWMFGTLAPAGCVEGSSMRTECLLRAQPTASIDVRVRFLQLVKVCPGDTSADDTGAVERDVLLDGLPLVSLCENPRQRSFAVGERPPGPDGATTRTEPITGALRVSASDVGAGAYRVSVAVENTTISRPDVDVLPFSFSSTHTILVGSGSEFCSLVDPPDDLRAQAAACRNVGTWPALLAHDAVLSSPIILPDFPAVAPESPGDLFDGTEIDEILTLRILTLTDVEKDEVRRQGGRTCALLERTEALGPRELSRLHGAVRKTSARHLRPGDRVKLTPRARADALDLLLAGRSAIVSSVEEDFEGTTYVTVTIDDDPGQDLGRLGQPGHRFFFRSDEVEPST